MNNEVKEIGSPTIYKINESCYVGVQFKEKRGDRFFDITLLNNDKEKFLGRFIKELDNIKILFKDDKILIYSDEFDSINKKMQIIKVYSLYNISDDLFYSCSEKEALNIFDSSIDCNYLYNNKNITRSDIEKKKRLNVNYGNNIDNNSSNNQKIIKFHN